jgi:hypothetical protein
MPRTMYSGVVPRVFSPSAWSFTVVRPSSYHDVQAMELILEEDPRAIVAFEMML